jgi:hypothetical protein
VAGSYGKKAGRTLRLDGAQRLDPILDQFSPGTSKALREADINCHRQRSTDIEAKIREASTGSGINPGGQRIKKPSSY